MVNADNTVVIFYWKQDQPFVIYQSHHVWFGEYKPHLSIEEKHTPGALLLQQYPESYIHHSDLLNFIPCKLDLISTPFFDKTIFT